MAMRSDTVCDNKVYHMASAVFLNTIAASIQNVMLQIQTGSENAILKCHPYCTHCVGMSGMHNILLVCII